MNTFSKDITNASIYFSKKTIEKASQLYLQNGNQNNSTLEHQHSLSGLTLVESWIVESETNDKSRMYNMDVPIGTWMGTVKVENDKVWNEYVKTNKVKGFSIEGYFADKMERPKDKVLDNYEIEAEQLLSKIESIVKGEKVSLSIAGDIKKALGQSKSLDSKGSKQEDKLINLAEKVNLVKLKSVKTTTLLIWGAKDTWIPLGNGKRMDSMLPNSKLVILKNSGHVPMEENPKESLEFLKSFLNESS